MEKETKETICGLAIITVILIAILSLCCLNSVANNKLDDEVVKVDDALMKSHPWEEAFFDISCVDSIQSEGGYYWFIYDDPDAFETTLCVSMNRNTYNHLVDIYNNISRNHPYTNAEERILRRFHLYYGNCEEVVLMFE